MQRRPSVGIKGHRFNAADADAGVRMAENFRDNEDRSRFELDVEGIIAFITYRKSPNAITLVHTEVPPELGGRGIGSKLGRDPRRRPGARAEIHRRMRFRPILHREAPRI